MSRLCSPQAYGALKGATAAALQAATPTGSTDAFAALTRVDGRTLRKYADHSHDMFIALDIAADLDRAAGKPIMAAALAQITGSVVVGLVADPHARVMSAIKEAGEAVAAVAQLETVGAWGLQQTKDASAQVREALASLAGLDAALTKRLEGSE